MDQIGGLKYLNFAFGLFIIEPLEFSVAFALFFVERNNPVKMDWRLPYKNNLYSN